MALNVGKAALALGALLAFQNRDKIADMMKGGRGPNSGDGKGGGLLDGLLGDDAKSGLNDILDRFRGTGSASEVDSWVGKEANRPLERRQVESAIDSETLDQLAAQTGLSREDLIERITRDLPSAVDAATPEGLPPAARPSNGNLLDDVR